MSLRIAVLGAGGHSRWNHGEALKLYDEQNPGQIELAAVCDLDADKAAVYAKECGFARTYTDFHAMVKAEKPDGLIAVTPQAKTFELVSELLGCGVGLTIEKPPGASAAQTRELAAIAERCGTPHMVSFNRRFHPAIEKARAFVEAQGEANAPLGSLARMLRVRRRDENFAFGTGIHCIDATLSLMGTPVSVVTRRVAMPIPGRTTYNAQMEFANGAIGTFVIAPYTGHHEETYELFGHDYYVHVDIWQCRIRIHQSDEVILDWTAPAEDPGLGKDGTLAETAAFIESLQGKRPWWPTLSEAVATMQAAEAIERGGQVDLAMQAT